MQATRPPGDRVHVSRAIDGWPALYGEVVSAETRWLVFTVVTVRMPSGRLRRHRNLRWSPWRVDPLS